MANFGILAATVNLRNRLIGIIFKRSSNQGLALPRPLFSLSNTGSEGSIALEQLFPGQYHNAETGLNYNYFRSYDASTGRYTQSDPLGLEDGPNTYSYVRNRPTYFTDPLGLSSCGAEGGRHFQSDFGTFSFEAACQKHDACYGTCGADKSECDGQFLGDMGKECKTKISPMLGNLLHRCLTIAQNYFTAVAQFGGDAYRKAQEKCEGCNGNN